jgi:GNAT superfamily N-acetyltransferase
MIRPCRQEDLPRIHAVINTAAAAYQGVIPADCYHDPYMPREELDREARRMTFYGWEDDGRLCGVVGYEPIKDVTLLRHCYVLPECQRSGIGSVLTRHVLDLTTTPRLLVGTWADAHWAIRFYEKHGFRLLPDKDALLRTYWDIPDRQIETSVVLGRELLVATRRGGRHR